MARLLGALALFAGSAHAASAASPSGVLTAAAAAPPLTANETKAGASANTVLAGASSPPPLPAAEVVYTIGDLITSGYTASDIATKRPPVSGAVQVDTKIVITNFMNLDQVSGSFEVQGTIMTVWKDLRLTMPTGATRVQLAAGDVWTPTYDFYNAVSYTTQASKIALIEWTDPAYKMYNYTGPTLVLTERFVATCAMRINFASYPFDKHALPIEIDLFGNPSEYVQYRTAEVVLMDGLSDPSWAINSAEGSIADVVKPTGLKYSRSTFHINVNRQWINKAFSIYVPLLFIFVLSYGSYYMDPAVLPARTALTIVSLLSSITYYGAIAAALPARGYLTYIDTYCICCIASCGIAVAIFLRVHWLSRCEKVPKKEGEEPPADSWLDKMMYSIPGYQEAPKSKRLDLMMHRIWPYFFVPTFFLIFYPMTDEWVIKGYQTSDFA